VVLAEATLDILATPRREIMTVASVPARPSLQHLVGERAGGNLRALLAREVPEEKTGGTPLYLLLDDFCGASLVAGWAWFRWNDDWLAAARQSGTASTAGKGGNMAGICTGFAPGSEALNPDGTINRNQNFCEVGPLVHPDDPEGWHLLADQVGVGMRRARRVDVWVEAGELRLKAGFQDSATVPEGGRVAIHEYRLTATADLATGALLGLTPDPRILPYKECPGAAANVQRMVGTPLAEMRERVLEILPGTLGCTHLNDVLRSLAEAPVLVGCLTRRS